MSNNTSHSVVTLVIHQQDMLDPAEQTKPRNSKRYPKWMAHSADTRAKFKIPADATPWTDENPKLRGVPVGCPRVLDLLNVAWARRLQTSKNREMALRGFRLDLSQAVQLKPWRLTGGIGMLLPGTA